MAAARADEADEREEAAEACDAEAEERLAYCAPCLDETEELFSFTLTDLAEIEADLAARAELAFASAVDCAAREDALDWTELLFEFKLFDLSEMERDLLARAFESELSAAASLFCEVERLTRGQARLDNSCDDSNTEGSCATAEARPAEARRVMAVWRKSIVGG